MVTKIFSIFDQKAKCHLPPFFLHESGQAVRAFSDCVNDPNHNFGKHPEDYTLVAIGEFDDIDGHILAYNHPQLVTSALAVVQDRLPLEDKQESERVEDA